MNVLCLAAALARAYTLGRAGGAGGACDTACGFGDGCACYRPMCCDVCAVSDTRYCSGRGRCIEQACLCDPGYRCAALHAPIFRRAGAHWLCW